MLEKASANKDSFDALIAKTTELQDKTEVARGELTPYFKSCTEAVATAKDIATKLCELLEA